MPLKNINDSLVNGLRGVVTGIFEESVDVKFEISTNSFSANIKPSIFTTFDPVNKTTLAKRTQIPLKIAFDITIHKSLGMSLYTIIVNCQNYSQLGQLYVAIGRATSV